MSLSVYLEIDDEEVFETNITHNLSQMAREAGIYNGLWRPEENDVKTAADIIRVLEPGLNDMVARPDHYKQFDAPNGWGLYEDFIPWLREFLEACKRHPTAEVWVWR